MEKKRLTRLALWALLFLRAGELAAVQVADLSRDGIGITVDAEPEAPDPGRDFFVSITVEAPAGVKVTLPDLRSRFRGFRVAEDFAEEPVADAGGATTLVSRWRLVPEPVAEKYRLAPFVVAAVGADGAAREFCTKPVRFAKPAAREAATGEMEVAPERDLPPLSWKLAGMAAGALGAAALLVWGILALARKVSAMVRVHRMSPIERAMYELGVLLGKGLPGRGFYKDFYVELTMVVRRYIERRHKVRAPNLTTWEFLEEAKGRAFSQESLAELRTFLESADMVKFAGVEATPEMADAATDRARDYLRKDNEKSGGEAEEK